MADNRISRRDWMIGTGSAVAAGMLPLSAKGVAATRDALLHSTPVQTNPDASDADRARRMKWWHEARFGMFIHWGLYSLIGRHEWVMENEGIPVSEYAPLAKKFKPKPFPARDWAKLARETGMKYMVMTTKHHEGFCQFDTKTTDYCAPKQGPGRDLVREYVDAARAEGMRVGFYYSLMDWHHPDGARCATDEDARKRFVEYIHTHVRELMSNYGKIDVLWYDVAWPLDKDGWESERMNKMVFELQPDIIVNNRNRLPGDFSTPEQHITAEKGERAWESCMTLNDSWGYQRADDDWKSPRRIVQNLIECSRDTGNYLLNIGPRGDGVVPEESVRVLTQVGDWVRIPPERRNNLQFRSMPAAPLELCELHAQGEHPIHACALLAGRLRGHRGNADQSQIRKVSGGRQGNQIRTGPFPRSFHGSAHRGPRSSCNNDCDRMRFRADARQHFRSQGKTTGWSLSQFVARTRSSRRKQ